jgi:hypothetical protein
VGRLPHAGHDDPGKQPNGSRLLDFGFEFQTATTLTVIASEAKQSIVGTGQPWIASSLALLAMTEIHSFAISPHIFRASFAFSPAPYRRAQGMPSAPCAPAASHAK